MAKKKKQRGIKIEAYPASQTFEIALTSISMLASAIVQQLGGKEVMQTIGDRIAHMENTLSQKLDKMENTLSQKLDKMENTLSQKLDKIENTFSETQNATLNEIRYLRQDIQDLKIKISP